MTYIPKHFEQTDRLALQALVTAHPLGAWVTSSGGELLVNHIPFLIDRSRGEYGCLLGHVARANPVWRSFSEDTPSVVIFQGPQAYITPSWYPSKEEHGKAVPTWNYAVVHAHGIPRTVEDRDSLLRHVTQLSNRHESTEPRPWSVTDAPADYIDGMLRAIVGIEIPITRLVGKWKVSQNRPAADIPAIAAGLRTRDDSDSQSMANLVQQGRPA
jgi:transcriptional regulator